MAAATLLPIALLLFLPLLLLSLIFRGRGSTSPKLRLPPSPPKLPIIGNLHQLGSLPHRSLRSLSQKHGPLMLLQLGQVPTLIVSSAEAAREIMKTRDLIFASRPPLEAARVLLYERRDFAFAPYGEHWRQLRKLCVTHLLNTKMVQSFRLARAEEVAFLIDRISSLSLAASSPDGAEVDMGEFLHSFSSNMLCRVVSAKLFREEGRSGMFHELIEETNALLGAFHVEDYLPSLAWLDQLFFGLNARAKRVFRRWDDILDRAIEGDGGFSADDGSRGEDFVHVLLSLEKDPNMDFILTKEHIKALLVEMFDAGTGTAYITLEWALAELVRNNGVMKKLQDEIRGIANGRAKVREEDLNEMSYLKAVLKEVLRLHPPGTLLLPRESMEDCQIQGYDIPKKTRVIINAWTIARDPKFWEEPEEFQPERFLNSSTDFKGNDFQFIPFGAGRRICPGMNFAVSNMELVLANLVHQFDWKLPDGMTTEEMDMGEVFGLTTHRKQRLKLLAKPYSS